MLATDMLQHAYFWLRNLGKLGYKPVKVFRHLKVVNNLNISGLMVQNDSLTTFPAVLNFLQNRRRSGQVFGNHSSRTWSKFHPK